MSNASSIKSSAAHKKRIAVPADTIPVSARPKVGIKNWYIDFLVIVVGLPSLVFFVALGGVFALTGPWVILIGVVSIKKRARYLSFIAGVILLLLSTVGLLLPNQTGSWSTVCGLLGLFGVLGYLTMTLLDMRKSLR
jgi:hypothetical protein